MIHKSGCCSFCGTPWVSSNVHVGGGDEGAFNACGAQKCQELIGEIVKKAQEAYRAANKKDSV